MIVKPRPWWKFWPVVCWRHWRLVAKNDLCPKCSEEIRQAKMRRIVEKMEQAVVYGRSVWP